MPTVQINMTKESYAELKELAQEIGEPSVASLARTSLGLLHYLQCRISEGYNVLLLKEGEQHGEKVVFPLKKGVLINSEEVAPEGMLEYDVVVRIPPKESYTIQMRVESVEKGKPVIVEPEVILLEDEETWQGINGMK